MRNNTEHANRWDDMVKNKKDFPKKSIRGNFDMSMNLSSLEKKYLPWSCRYKITKFIRLFIIKYTSLILQFLSKALLTIRCYSVANYLNLVVYTLQESRFRRLSLGELKKSYIAQELLFRRIEAEIASRLVNLELFDDDNKKYYHQIASITHDYNCFDDCVTEYVNKIVELNKTKKVKIAKVVMAPHCYYGEEKDGSKQITIGTWQSAHKDTNLLKDIGFLLCDEAHSQKAQVVKALTQGCVNADFRLGCTGSLPEDPCDIMAITGSFGPILNKVKSDKLIERGLLSPIEITQIIYKYPEKLKRACRSNYRAEKKVIQEYRPRRELVEKIIATHKPKENILLLFDIIEFGKDYFKYLKASFPKREFFYVSGEVDVATREHIRTEADKRGGIVIVASSGVFAAGVNICRLNSLILLSGGKSPIRILQSLGRLLRLHKTKDIAKVFDICDYLGFSINHAKERRKLYEKQNFPYKIIDSKVLPERE